MKKNMLENLHTSLGEMVTEVTVPEDEPEEEEET